jgi:hypothetical protein
LASDANFPAEFGKRDRATLQCITSDQRRHAIRRRFGEVRPSQESKDEEFVKKWPWRCAGRFSRSHAAFKHAGDLSDFQFFLTYLFS